MSVSAALSVTALCCDHPHALTEVEEVVSKAFDKEGMLVGVGSYIGRTEVFLCFG